MAVGAAHDRPAGAIVEGMNMGFLLLAFNQISKQHGDACAYNSGGQLHDPHRWCEAPAAWAASSGRSTASALEAYFRRRAQANQNRGGEHPTNAQGADEGPPSATTTRALLRACAALTTSAEELRRG